VSHKELKDRLDAEKMAKKKKQKPRKRASALGLEANDKG